MLTPQHQSEIACLLDGEQTYDEAVADFHKHLDDCQSCREHPFALCSKGDALLQKAVRIGRKGML